MRDQLPRYVKPIAEVVIRCHEVGSFEFTGVRENNTVRVVTKAAKPAKPTFGKRVH